MRIFAVAAAGAFLMAAPASAQTETAPAAPAQSACEAVTPAPQLGVDGASATRAQMEAADATYRTWATATHAALACRQAEAQAAQARAQALSNAFNTDTAAFTAATNAWTAEVAEYNERNPSRPQTTRERSNPN